jgi:hypothetical protein
MLSEINQTQKDEYNRTPWIGGIYDCQMQRSRVDDSCYGVRSINEEVLDKMTAFSHERWLCLRYLLYSILPIVNNIAFHT